MKRKTRIAMAAVLLVSLRVICAEAQSTNKPPFRLEAPNARAGLLRDTPTSVQEYTREINGYIRRGETDRAGPYPRSLD